MPETLSFEVLDGAIGLLKLNPPKALHAINNQLVTELEGVLREQAGAGLRALVLTGEGGRAFAAGADISEMAGYTALQAEQFARAGQRVLGLLETFPAPTIAAVNGFALGGGCELAMCCDIILASTAAIFGQPEVKLGVIPGFGGTQRLVRRVGRQRAMELMMTGRNGPVAVRLVKRAVHETDRLDLDAGLAAEASLFGLCFASTDQKEGMAAFLEKRRAAFTGA